MKQESAERYSDFAPTRTIPIYKMHSQTLNSMLIVSLLSPEIGHGFAIPAFMDIVQITA